MIKHCCQAMTFVPPTFQTGYVMFHGNKAISMFLKSGQSSSGDFSGVQRLLLCGWICASMELGMT